MFFLFCMLKMFTSHTRYTSLISGSSREFVGFDTEADEFIIRCIWERAAEFFPKLRDISLEDFIRNRKVRVGLRPYSMSLASNASKILETGVWNDHKT